MDCNEFNRLLDDYLNGELPPASRAGFEGHSVGCPECGQKQTEAITLRNRLRSEFIPPEPDGEDSFHSFKRNFSLREESIKMKRRFGTVRAIGFASVMILLVGYLFINVPVSYSLPDGMSIVINFDPPLEDAPEFKGLILPKEFYDEVASSEDVLIERFITIQGPDGLTKIELDISKDDPEIAAKVYETLVKNYPALEAGEVEYHGIEEAKHEPLHVMLREWKGSDEMLSDEEIKKVIILKTPEINQWIDDEMMPLVKGIEIRIGANHEGLNIEDLMDQCEVKILKISPDDETDEMGSIKKVFRIMINEDGEDCDEITKDIFIRLNDSFLTAEKLFTDEDVEKLRQGDIAADEFEKIIIKHINGDSFGTAKNLYITGRGGDEMKDCPPGMVLDIDDGLLQKFIDGVISKDEFVDEIKGSIDSSMEGVDVIVKVLRLEDGELEFNDQQSFGIVKLGESGLCEEIGGEWKELEVELDDLEFNLDELEECLDKLRNCEEWEKEEYCKQFGKILEMKDTGSLLDGIFLEGLDEILKDCLEIDGMEFKILGDSSCADLQSEHGEKKIMVELDAFAETDGAFLISGEDSGIEFDELITPKERQALKDGKLTTDDLEEVVRERLDERGELDISIMICIADEEAAFTIKVEDGEVKIDYEPIG